MKNFANFCELTKLIHCSTNTWWYMKRLFVQAEYFKAELDSRETGAQLLKEIEEEILKNPEVGDTVAGTGGVRKMRMPDSGRGKGKRGGLRVLYLDLPDHEHTHLLVLYGKDQADDLSPQGRRMIKIFVEEIKRSLK